MRWGLHARSSPHVVGVKLAELPCSGNISLPVAQHILEYYGAEHQADADPR